MTDEHIGIDNFASTGGTPTIEELHRVVREGQKINERYREGIASAFLGDGIVLIPNEHLKDHQFMVSPKIYDAALKLLLSKADAAGGGE